MGAGAFIEPLVVVTLLFGGTWINRDTNYRFLNRKRVYRRSSRSTSPASSFDSGRSSIASESPLLPQIDEEPRWRRREVQVPGIKRDVKSPNTRIYQDYFLSRLLRKFPFLVEAWYWALIYWVYQLGRAFSAVTMVEGTVTVARRHALQLIHLEERLHIFIELDVQNWFLKHPLLLHWTNRTYSFIHIPGTILFLVWLFYYTSPSPHHSSLPLHTKPTRSDAHSAATPALYAARRRTMATCNLLAFIIFTLWPCMPPRLLSDASVPGPVGDAARSYGFIDTVHGAAGETSVWTQNKFCNQYAAMPSLHFGYSLLVGLTIMSIPLAPRHARVTTVHVTRSVRLRVPSARRAACVLAGVAYPCVILVAIVATANHFVLDAVAGALVCGLAWTGNGVVGNLLPLEDYFLGVLRIHKPERRVAWVDEDDDEQNEYRDGKGGVL